MAIRSAQHYAKKRVSFLTAKKLVNRIYKFNKIHRLFFYYFSETKQLKIYHDAPMVSSLVGQY